METAICPSPVEWAQILTLQIFQQRNLQGLLVGEGSDDCRDYLKAGSQGRAPPSFPRHQFVALFDGAYDNRL
jgi:hypothetical protein